MRPFFVYGTLRPYGAEPTHRLRGFIMRDYGNFPILHADETHTSIVVGNLLEVDEHKEAEFDYIENLRTNLFIKAEVAIEDIATKQQLKAFCYIGGYIMDPVFGVWNLPIIESGDWKEYEANRLPNAWEHRN
jgi:gamma-glutamylcyclotransferase (GGCT)/AIG2-like uncharacterized protein YtfP